MIVTDAGFGLGVDSHMERLQFEDVVALVCMLID